MRALWTQEEASYDGEFVKFGASWAWPKPPQGQVPVIIGAGAGPKTFAWIAENADGWMTTPIESDVPAKVAALKEAWAAAGREGSPEVHVLIAMKPSPEDLAAWAECGVTELIWGLPDKSADEVIAFIGRHGERLGLSGSFSGSLPGA
jgi:alkanesulfonate monooxygenase SsuD/methylene tetrahydromethanopterin reductase-like flavin-dependent oxidoreductase (luciferase family)